MGHPVSKWKNKKRYPKRIYYGFHDRSGNGKRRFVLKVLLPTGKVHVLIYASHESAKAKGWRHLK